MPGRKSKKEVGIYTPKKKSKSSWIDFLRLDESYTSLILGIIVVIIGSILLISYVKNRNSANLHKETSSISIAPTINYNVPLTLSPTTEVTSVTIVQTPTFEPTLTTTPQPTIAQKQNQPMIAEEEYIVKPGDDLWNIALHKYGSGYNWVDIAKTNNLTNPGLLYSGMKLKLPNVAPKIISNTNNVQNNNPNAITGTTYTVQKGDTLWGISVRAYNDGYQWTKLASANHLTNPGLIFSGNVLQIPR